MSTNSFSIDCEHLKKPTVADPFQRLGVAEGIRRQIPQLIDRRHRSSPPRRKPKRGQAHRQFASPSPSRGLCHQLLQRELKSALVEEGLLKPVHFLKVSHHGSHNGTPTDSRFEAILPAAPLMTARAMPSSRRGSTPIRYPLAERATVHSTLDHPRRTVLRDHLSWLRQSAHGRGAGQRKPAALRRSSPAGVRTPTVTRSIRGCHASAILERCPNIINHDRSFLPAAPRSHPFRNSTAGR
jgi:hypothetical protein